MEYYLGLWNNYLDLYTDGAKAMISKISGAIAKIKHVIKKRPSFILYKLY